MGEIMMLFESQQQQQGIRGVVETEIREARTILDFLSDRMDGGDHVQGTRRRTLKQRLGFMGIIGGCCGGARATTWWMYRRTPTIIIAAVDRDQEEEEGEGEINDPARSTTGINLAAALAAEREYRAAQDQVGTPLRMSLMRLLEEEPEPEPEERGTEAAAAAAMGNDRVCCVCMGREKGAAFIPCGHTFCRVCSRELWVNRGSCPLCNRFILDILHIF